MNESTSAPLPPSPQPPKKPQAPQVSFEALPQGLGFLQTFEALLKRPGSTVRALEEEGPQRFLGKHSAAALSCLLPFGLVLGAFSGGTQFWAAPLKIVVGLSLSALICLPSFYIFLCLAGVEVRFSTVAGLLVACITLTALLLVGFAPLLWIFSTSTDSLPFIGFLIILVWIVSLLIAFKIPKLLLQWLQSPPAPHLSLWKVLFVFVTLQMSTTLRPLVGRSEVFLTNEKKFFLVHWLEESSRPAK
ncbi:MAG: hypothetical protein AAF555_00230 [Verrucomicrobiota bacterium]